jgi:chromosome segregation ATPase
MNRTTKLIAFFAAMMLLPLAVAGCTQAPPKAVEPAKQAVDQQTEQTQASVDATLNAIQDKVTELAKTAGGLETRVNGLQVNSDLQGIQRQLTDAIGQTGDKKKAALDQLSTSFDNVIAKLDEAAAKLPAGGQAQAELTSFSQQLKDIQAELAAAANTSTTP